MFSGFNEAWIEGISRSLDYPLILHICILPPLLQIIKSSLLTFSQTGYKILENFKYTYYSWNLPEKRTSCNDTTILSLLLPCLVKFFCGFIFKIFWKSIKTQFFFLSISLFMYKSCISLKMHEDKMSLHLLTVERLLEVPYSVHKLDVCNTAQIQLYSS
jgi:hypothetical protein